MLELENCIHVAAFTRVRACVRAMMRPRLVFFLFLFLFLFRPANACTCRLSLCCYTYTRLSFFSYGVAARPFDNPFVNSRPFVAAVRYRMSTPTADVR